MSAGSHPHDFAMAVVSIGPSGPLHPLDWMTAFWKRPFAVGEASWKQTDQPPAGGATLELTNRRWVVSGGALLMLARHVGVTGELFYQRASVSSTFSGEENEDRAEMYGLRWGIAAFVF